MSAPAVMSFFDASKHSDGCLDQTKNHSSLDFFSHFRNSQQGLPPPSQNLQRSRPPPIAPNYTSSPNQSSYSNTHSALGIYASPQSTTPTLSHQQPPYQGSGSSSSTRSHVDNPSYSTSHQSTFSGTSAPGNFTPADTPEMMSAPHLRSQLPAYGTPQSNSPASTASPHESQHRQLYGQPHQQNMFYSNYQMPGSSSYLPSSAPSQHHLSSQPSMPVHYPQGPLPPPSSHSQTPIVESSPRNKFSQTPLSGYGGTPQLGSSRPNTAFHSNQPGSHGGQNSAAPGPIPATQPIVMKKGSDGVEEITFEYSRDRIKVTYTIRGDIDKVNTDDLGHDFKEQNCVYPRACSHKDEYKGNRLHYETECNKIAWALAWLNPQLHSKRGLIQRAVDSWRNCHKDPKVRSRRVRRMQKQTIRQNKHGQAASVASATPSIPGQPDTGGMAGLKHEQSGFGMSAVQHHQYHGDQASRGGVGDMNANNIFNPSSQPHGQPGHQSIPPLDSRSSHGFYADHTRDPRSAPSGTMSVGGYGVSNVTGSAGHAQEEKQTFDDHMLFGDMGSLPQSGQMVIKDIEQPNVKVPRHLTNNVQEITDDWRRKYAIFPRSCNIDAPLTGDDGSDISDDEDDNENNSAYAPSMAPAGRTTMAELKLLNGYNTKMPVPKMTKSRRARERALNEMGARMSWEHGRKFCDEHQEPQVPRTMFLQRSLGQYRQNMSKQFDKHSRAAPSHFEAHPGRRRWLERPGKPTRDKKV